MCRIEWGRERDAARKRVTHLIRTQLARSQKEECRIDELCVQSRSPTRCQCHYIREWKRKKKARKEMLRREKELSIRTWHKFRSGEHQVLCVCVQPRRPMHSAAAKKNTQTACNAVVFVPALNQKCFLCSWWAAKLNRLLYIFITANLWRNSQIYKPLSS